MKQFDVLVVGGGHAGVEAALASSRIGLTTALITLDKRSIARMSCNPAIGGSAKGHLVREIDALGGEMGLAADNTGIQFKTLNRSKGRAVRSPRAQIDKRFYEKHIQRSVNSEPKLSVLEGDANSILTMNEYISGIRLHTGESLYSKAVVLTCGTFLNGLIHIGRRKIHAGRMGEEASSGISEDLISLGFKLGRLKTGTPPRIKKESVNWKKLKILYGDPDPRPFSFFTHSFTPPNVPCYIAETNIHTHTIIRNSLKDSPMYSGEIKGVGPRYCPSIEDKVVRFSGKKSHHLFLEPEWKDANQIYTNGFSTSLPEKIQLRALQTVVGLENIEFVRPGYAIEYDFFSPSQLKASLETKKVRGLFFAGQINGTSGYEEAAAQGLIAGINAALFAQDKLPIILKRDRAYIGVLIDDLITKDTEEPYRMFTARAEYRLMLRHSNAGRRLSEIGYNVGLLSKKKYNHIHRQLSFVDTVIENLETNRVSHQTANSFLSLYKESHVKSGVTLSSLLKRPKITVRSMIEKSLLTTPANSFLHHRKSELLEEAETSVKYEGYIKRQKERVAFLQKSENTPIPKNTNYMTMIALSNEAKEKLSLVRPETLGQASRISGVSPSDISVLTVLLSR